MVLVEVIPHLLLPPNHISLKLPRDERESKEGEFTMFVMDVSYFSGKLECYFNFQVTSR